MQARTQPRSLARACLVALAHGLAADALTRGGVWQLQELAQLPDELKGELLAELVRLGALTDALLL